jgi:type IV pilus assembly protein PilC
MPEFVCRIADDRGQIMNRVEVASSESELRDRLAQAGQYVFSIHPRGSAAGLFSGRNATKKIKMGEFLVFNQQFITLMKAGLPILKVLELLSGHIAQPSMRASLNEIRDRVKGGALLSEAFAEQAFYPEIYTTSLLAGEKSGNLEEVMQRYITYQRTAQTVKKKLIASLVYPALLVGLVMVLVTFLVTYVIPSFASLYSTMSQDLPAITVFLINFTGAIRNSWIIIMLGLAGAGFFFWSWGKTESGAQGVDRLKSKLPGVGAIWTKFQVAQFSRILATLLAGGIPLVQALETSRNSVGSALLKRTLEVATQAVREGKSLHEGLAATGFFPGLAIEMIEVGESSGALQAMLNGVADFFEEDVQTVLAGLLSLIEPAILLFMGTVVAFILIALYMPIFSLAGKI